MGAHSLKCGRKKSYTTLQIHWSVKYTKFTSQIYFAYFHMQSLNNA